MISGIGIDIVDIDRMKLAINRHPNIVKRILNENELVDLGLPIDGTYRNLDDAMIGSIAVRFACKEATVKSVHESLFKIGFHSVEILRSKDSGAPKVSLKYDGFDHLSFLCSLTHSAKSAAAVVIAQD